MCYKNLTGQVIAPTDNDYDEARSIYNAMIDKRPALIVKCDKVSDVVNAVNHARENGIEVSIKGGGHNGAGLSLVENGLVIDVSGMKTYDIDPKASTIRVDPGFTLSEIGEITKEHGLYLPYGINGTTGISGLTLGGGLGYLSRKGGLTIDNLLECKVVLADGNVVEANQDSHSDLFWALRGGGGNFGVVVSFKFKLLPVSTVYGGPMIWEMEDAESAFRFYEQFTDTDDYDLYGFFPFLTVPPAPPFPEEHWNKRACGVVWNYTGPLEQAEELFRPIRNTTHPIIDFVGEMSIHQLNTLFDDLYPKGMQWYWRAHYINNVPSESLDINIKYGRAIPNVHSTTHFYPIDGKVHEIDADQTAWANRGVRWAQVIVGVDPEPGNARKITDWCKNYYDELRPYAVNHGSYVNFMMEEGEERVKASYGDNYKRLSKIKARYDPANFFHINQNIQPKN